MIWMWLAILLIISFAWTLYSAWKEFGKQENTARRKKKLLREKILFKK